MLLEQALRHTAARYPGAGLTVFVDDTSIEATGSRAQVRANLIGAALEFARLADSLELQFSKTKSVLLASRGDLADQVARALPELHLRPARGAIVGC